jgi:DNA-binding HxlR family transcriptional regulator
MATGEMRIRETSVSRMVEDVVGCKWSMAVLASVRTGVNRPGAIERRLPGLTTKVLNERLRKLLSDGILTRMAFPIFRRAWSTSSLRLGGSPASPI